MATAVSARPALPPQKIKRPPPPMVQTSMNGVKSSQSSPSPSLSSKRPPTGFKHPPNTPATNGVNSTVNGAGPRISNRRRDSQRPSDITRPPRSVRLGTGDGGHNDRRASKRMPEPYVKTTAYMLKKYRKAAPSLILHLHPTHFRFDLQDGSFSYNSPMRMLLEHVKSQTVPHDMLDELKHAGVKFYENCLLVQIQDHRNNSTASQPSSSTATVDTNVPFSIHNYTEHLTPSPFVPYPHSNSLDRSSDLQSKTVPNTSAADVVSTGSEKENVLPKEEPHDGTASTSKGPKIFTTVLFSTPSSLQEELLTFANMPDHRANNRKQSQMSARTPASATMPHPPTPSSAVLSATPFPLGPPSKRQKMMFTGKDLAVLEEKLIAATAPPLFLDPVDSAEEVRELLHKLQDPLSSNKPPAPKSRKRTVAELAADEALAAEEQRFMLIMDERLVPTAATAGVGNAAAADDNAGAASFEPRFERFKAIEEIRHAHQEKAQREAEQKQQLQHQQQAMKQRMEQQQRENQQQNNHLKIQEAARRSQAMLQMQNQQLHQQQMMHQPHQPHLPPGSISHGHPQTSNTMTQNAFQIAASQGQHSSPIVRNMTPMNVSSPLVGDVMINRGGHSASMNVTSSNQGAGSPPRPGSAAQHAHPSVTASMTGQRSQQPPSRNGTPQMSNGTPRLQQSTPVISNVTPTPRMSHDSPVNPTMAATSVLGHNNMAVPPHGNHTFPMTPQQQQMQHQMAVQRQAQINHQHQQLQQGSPPNPQLAMSPQNLQQLAAHHAMQAQQMRAKDDAYRQQLHAMQQHQMGASGAGVTPMGPNNMTLAQQMQMTPNVSQQPGAAQNQYWSTLYKRYGSEVYQSMLVQAQGQYGTQIPQQILLGMRQQAAIRARAMIKQKQQSVIMNPQQQQQFAMQQAAAQSQQQQQHQQQQQAANQVLAQQGFHGMNGMNGIGGME
ncbi:Transcription factor spt20 [Xylographa vitiligo]|nr:Transcription factor spt20 [Xylographa vitiligo]